MREPRYSWKRASKADRRNIIIVTLGVNRDRAFSVQEIAAVFCFTGLSDLMRVQSLLNQMVRSGSVMRCTTDRSYNSFTPEEQVRQHVWTIAQGVKWTPITRTQRAFNRLQHRLDILLLTN